MELELPPRYVAVRVIIDEEGYIEIAPSPLTKSSEGPHASRFAESVRRAVEHWMFTPAEQRIFRDGDDLDGDGSPDYQVLVESRPVRIRIDFLFTFEVKGGVGVVRQE